MPIRVTVWTDDAFEVGGLDNSPTERIREDWQAFSDEQRAAYAALFEASHTTYPGGLNGVIRTGLERDLADRVTTRTARFGEPEDGLGDLDLAETDVLIWWSHLWNEYVDDTVVERVWQRVLAGMGLIVLHSGLRSKLFRRLMGTSCNASWRDEGERELMWTLNPAHPIAATVPHPLVIPSSEMLGEHIDIPAPDELVFVSSYAGGEVMRSGCCYFRGAGRIFFFSPGHETYPIFSQPAVQQVIANAVGWAFNEDVSPSVLAENRHRPTGWYK